MGTCSLDGNTRETEFDGYDNAILSRIDITTYGILSSRTGLLNVARALESLFPSSHFLSEFVAESEAPQNGVGA